MLIAQNQVNRSHCSLSMLLCSIITSFWCMYVDDCVVAHVVMSVCVIYYIYQISLSITHFLTKTHGHVPLIFVHKCIWSSINFKTKNPFIRHGIEFWPIHVCVTSHTYMWSSWWRFFGSQLEEHRLRMLCLIKLLI